MRGGKPRVFRRLEDRRTQEKFAIRGSLDGDVGGCKQVGGGGGGGEEGIPMPSGFRRKKT